MALAKLEVGQKAKHIGKNVGYLVVGGAVAYAAIGRRFGDALRDNPLAIGAVAVAVQIVISTAGIA